ncbi:MAG: hypothetical protein P8I91_02660 [Phycisphaerales bacterium]|nr:hypothetical protein [Phycisphaerales bacterium]
MQFTFDAAFAKGMALFKSRYGGLLAATLVFILILVGIGLVKALVNSVLGADPNQKGATATDHLIDIFTSAPLAAGILLIALLHLRGESPAMGTLFAGFRRYWPLVGIGVLVKLIFMAPVVVAALFLGFGALFIGGTSAALPAITVTAILVGLVLICIFIMLFTKLIFASLLCIDPRTRLGVCDSISTSWRITGPVFGPLLGLIIVMGLIFIGTSIVLVLPLFFVGIPLCLAITVSAYELIMSEQDEGEMGTGHSTEKINAS